MQMNDYNDMESARTNKKYAVFTMDVESFSTMACVDGKLEAAGVDLLDGLDRYIALLDKHDIKATLFVVGNVAEKVAYQLKKYSQAGHSIALHGNSHVAPMFIDKADFYDETTRGKAILEEITGVSVMGYRAPYFSLDNERLKILKQLGFAYDASKVDDRLTKFGCNITIENLAFDRFLCGAYRHREYCFCEYSVPSSRILGTSILISGGAFVRLSNWPFMKAVIRSYIRRNDYYVFYLHPFELTEQDTPAIKGLPFRDKIYIKSGIRSYLNKVEEIVIMLKEEGFAFATFDELTSDALAVD